MPAWAIAGIAAIFAEAIVRLGSVAFETVRGGLSPAEWAAFAAIAVAMMYFEGYRALHRRMAPRVVKRALDLGAGAHPARHALLAPLYALSVLGSDRRAVGRTWLTIALIAAAVVLVRLLPPPWRGIIDGAVALALTLGLASIVVRFVRARP